MDGGICMAGAAGVGDAGISTGDVGGASAGMPAAHEVISCVTSLGSRGGIRETGDSEACGAGSVTLTTSSELLLGRLGDDSVEVEGDCAEPEPALFFLMEKAFLNETGLMRRARARRISSFSRGRLAISRRDPGPAPNTLSPWSAKESMSASRRWKTGWGASW